MWQVDSTADPITGCLWPLKYHCATAELLDPDIVEDNEQRAVNIVWAASGKQYGICRTTRRPCKAECMPAMQRIMLPMPDLVSRLGSPLMMHCGRCRTDCSCGTLQQVRLPHKHVRRIESVQVDGVELDPTTYRLRGRFLIRTDGSAWPDCQDWTVDNGEAGSWSVTYTHGRPVPRGGQVAAGILAAEYHKFCGNDSDCALPERIKSRSVNGQVVTFTDPLDYLDEWGKVGIRDVDNWIFMVNPGRQRRPPRIIRADAV